VAHKLQQDMGVRLHLYLSVYARCMEDLIRLLESLCILIAASLMSIIQTMVSQALAERLQHVVAALEQGASS
jgi:hypothetical protein